ncbi:MAG: XdhC/CoxI family protein [Acholeplasmataceae bacterium]|nr:XdhC/CoxI family protein [Acholeplasmataceae bacterium]
MNTIYEKIVEYKAKNIDMVLVTAIEKTGEGPVEVGKKMLVLETGESFGTVGGGALEFYATEKAKDLIKKRKHLTEKYLLDKGKVIVDAKTLPMVCGGTVTLFYEFLGVRNYIYIFGAGHVGQALVNVLKPLNFHITVIDERKEVISNFKDGDLKVFSHFAPYIEENGIKEGSYVVVCTPSHINDYHVINKILELKLRPRYIGMLCSPEKLKDYLGKTYDKFGKDIDLSNFYSPIGLDLGGGSPEDIAISISAEILAIYHEKEGHKHMREVTHEHHIYWKNK